VCWVAAAIAYVWLALVWLPLFFAGSAGRGELSNWFWAVDLCASLAAQSVICVAFIFGVLLLLRRRACACAVCVVLVGLVVLPISEPRLGRAPGDAESVRLLVYNSHTQSNDIDLKNAMLTGSDVDVAVVLEISTGMMRSYIAGKGFRSTHGYGELPRSTWSGGPAILSRLPVESRESDVGRGLRQLRRDLWDHLYRLEIIHAPAGSFVLIQAHARSPRRAARWAYGLDQLLQLADMVKRVEELVGLPVVVAGDFNSPPTSVRARAFADRSGLVRAKPAFTLGGTFPSALPGAVSLAIDGVYASPGVGVKSWETIGSAGSDHRAVVIELVFDQWFGSGSDSSP
jgi:endonuclease/exonuclease/phosphatase (EEP) superfamily protein YafD